MIIYNILLFLIVLGVLIIAHEFGHFLIAKLSEVKVESFSVGFGPSLIKKQVGETLYKISLIPFGGYVKLAGEIHDDSNTGADWEFVSKPAWKRFLILTSGPIFNYLLALIMFIALFISGIPRMNTQIGKTVDNYPAQKAGLKKNDKIVAINNKKVSHWQEVLETIKNSKKGAINIKIHRPNEGKMNVNLKPRIEEKKNIFGQREKRPVIGIYPSGEVEEINYSVSQGVVQGTKHIFHLSSMTIKGIWNMIIGNISLRETATGPLGIYHITSEAAKEGYKFLLNIVAVISMSLAIINLFPFPVLDGGHVLFLFIEKVKGSPLSPKIQQITMQLGMYILIALMIYLLYIDFIRFY